MKIHYFQRYHSKENVDTANTMLLLSRLYSYSTDKFYLFLKQSVFPENTETELIFTLQEKCKDSVPDATITQPSFKIAVETKLHGQFTVEQLINHLNSFHNEEYKVLLTLDPKDINMKIKDSFEIKLEEYNQLLEYPVIHKHMTFEKIIEGVKMVIDDRDFDMLDVLEDYENYCYEESLITDEWKRMRVQLASVTLEDNMKLGLYYDNADRGFSGHDYIGLYSQKSVRAIGKIKAIVSTEKVNGEIEYKVEKGTINDDMKSKIIQAIDGAKKFGYVLEKERYFFVDKFYETDFKKNSPRAPMGSRMFDLTDVLGIEKLPNVKEIASLLKNVTWS